MWALSHYRVAINIDECFYSIALKNKNKAALIIVRANQNKDVDLGMTGWLNR